MNNHVEGDAVASGVDELIAKLREDGGAAGRAEAERSHDDARAAASRILANATQDAHARRDKARNEAEGLRRAGEEALKTAVRDTVLTMKTGLMESFRADVQRLVSHELADTEMLRRMILEVAGRLRDSVGTDDAASVEVVLPANIVGLEELRRAPEALGKGALTEFVFGLTGEMLREGVTFTADDDVTAGVKVNVTDRNVTLDLTDKGIASLLLQHLQPRFRAILEGVVR
jgi:V/A-type H+-transporting ATPase subunit E